MNPAVTQTIRLAELERTNAELLAGLEEVRRLSEERTEELERLSADVDAMQSRCADLQFSMQGLERTIEEQKKLVELLKRVPHHGPQGSSSTPLCPPGCWPDCVACEYERLLRINHSMEDSR